MLMQSRLSMKVSSFSVWSGLSVVPLLMPRSASMESSVVWLDV
jgi:hypothetical protein